MLSFKDFFHKDSFVLKETFSHDNIGNFAERLDNIKNTLIGRKTKSVQFVRNYNIGEPVSFGADKKTGANFLTVGKNTFYSPEDIDRAYKPSDSNNASFKQLFQHVTKMIPRDGGVYSGRFLNNKKYYTESRSPSNSRKNKSGMSLILNGKYDLQGNVRPIDPSKLNKSPGIDIIDPVIRKTIPTHFSPEEQQSYNHHILNANKIYSSLKPDAFDHLGKHHDEIQNFVAMHRGEKPPKIEEYAEYIRRKNSEKISKALPKQQDNASRELSDMLGTIRPHFSKIILMQHHLKNANKILTNVISKHPAPIEGPHDIQLYHKGQTTNIA